MKLLVDMNLSPSWVQVLLATERHTAAHGSQLGKLDATDQEIRAFARQHGWIVLL